MTRKLYRSRKNNMISGVCGGVGEYFNIDPNIVRILWVLFGLGGMGIIVYIVCACILEYAPEPGVGPDGLPPVE